jgi:hypothetical protein
MERPRGDVDPLALAERRFRNSFDFRYVDQAPKYQGETLIMFVPEGA